MIHVLPYMYFCNGIQDSWLPLITLLTWSHCFLQRIGSTGLHDKLLFNVTLFKQNAITTNIGNNRQWSKIITNHIKDLFILHKLIQTEDPCQVWPSMIDHHCWTGRMVACSVVFLTKLRHCSRAGLGVGAGGWSSVLMHQRLPIWEVYKEFLFSNVRIDGPRGSFQLPARPVHLNH